jgi:hypothetical protein
MQLGDGTILEQCSDDEQGVASSGQKTTPLNAPVEEKPQLSWTLTLTLLVVVTIVRPLLSLLIQSTEPLLARFHHCRVACRIHE